MRKLVTILTCMVLLCNAFVMAEMEAIVDLPINVTPVENMQQNISITTGLPTDKEQHIMAIQMDNEPGARPQKGIGSADIVYEVEIYAGGYTRYTGIFNDNIPELVEAVRSTRMVQIDISKEFGGVFIHYGLGEGVGDYLNGGVRPEIRYDGLTGIAGFYRDKSRKAPNNVVCEFQDLFNKTDWSNTTARSPLQFSQVDYADKGTPVSEFSIEYRNGYCPSYEFRDGLYYRYYNGKPHNDGTTNEQLAYSNIIVQHVEQSWRNGTIPIVVNTGTGACEYFIDGHHFTGTWERADVNSNTIYRDADGNEVLFKPGKTFIQVVKQGVGVSIDGTDTPGTLKNGSRGEDVKKLQQKLLDMGLLNDTVDGIYGNNTAAAVSAAEALLGMEQTGVANPDFLEKLYAQ